MVKIETVRGSISPDELGVTLPHEHVLIDLAATHITPATSARGAALLDSPVSMKILGELRRSFTLSKDNLKLSDVDAAIEELRLFSEAGGRSLVDVTPSYSAPATRSPDVMREISEKAEVNIVVGTGFYVQASHPRIVQENSVRELCQLMVRDLSEGFEGSQIRAGMIGELGCGVPIDSDEEKVLRAAALAQGETRACIIIHSGTFDPFSRTIAKEANSYLDILEAEGADLTRVCVGHMDFTSSDLKYQEQILNRGAFIAYDTFGCEFYRDDLWIGATYPTDTQRVAGIVELCKKGYDGQLLLSQDTCIKMQTVAYGGYGYAHILQHIVPCLRQSGVGSAQIHNMLIDNPKKLLQI